MIPGLIAAAVGGLLLALAFPPIGFDLSSWVAFVPFFWALSRESRPGWAALQGGAFGFAFFLVDVNWAYDTLVIHGHFAAVTAAMVFAGMILILIMFPAAFALILTFLKSRGVKPFVFAPFVWVGIEYIRSTALTGFPWDLVGYSQMQRLSLVQIADITGVYGISFLVVMVNVALWELLNSMMNKQAISMKLPAIATALFILIAGYGFTSLHNRFPPRRSLPNDSRVGMLQGNIAQEVKWEEAALPYTFYTYEKLGRTAVNQGAQFLVWPETSVPVPFGGIDATWKEAGMISEKLGVPMLVGAPSSRVINGSVHYFNSAFLLNRDAVMNQYDKIHLVPFGEYMPLTWLLPLGPGIAAREADYSSGTSMTIMTVKGVPRFGVLICYEAIFPELARMAVNQGAQMLINITNDGWFGRSAAPYQHFTMARMRSIENRVWLLRAANTGISAAIDPAGRVVDHIPLEQEGAIVVGVPAKSSSRTFYTEYGDVFSWSCTGILAAAMLSAMDIRVFRSSRS
jgi:apolipoprotein N-acyltransferase